MLAIELNQEATCVKPLGYNKINTNKDKYHSSRSLFQGKKKGNFSSYTRKRGHTSAP
jgi:hypothetical protein